VKETAVVCRKDEGKLEDYLLDFARFFVQCLGHLLVNSKRLEKGYGGGLWGRNRGMSWKSLRRVITPPTSYYSPSPPYRAVLAFLFFCPLPLSPPTTTSSSSFVASTLSSLLLPPFSSRRSVADCKCDSQGMHLMVVMVRVWPVTDCNYLRVEINIQTGASQTAP